MGSFDDILCLSKLQTVVHEFFVVKIAKIHDFYKKVKSTDAKNNRLYIMSK